MTANSDAFPRGGIKSTSIKKPTFEKEKNLFGQDSLSDQSKKKKKSKKSTTNDAEIEDYAEVAPQAKSAETLTYQKIHEGMLFLGCIRKIKSVTIECELPGRTFGEIHLKNVSARYLKLVTSVVNKQDDSDIHSLSDIFHVGQYLPVRVYNIERSGKVIRVQLSTNPADINAHLQHLHFYQKSLTWGSISEKSDHGYVVDLGVRNTRTHLPFSACGGEDYKVGQVLYLAVTKIEKNREASTLTVSTLKEDIEATVAGSSSNLDRLIPGVQVDYTVKNILKDGLEGSLITSEFLGYVNELYLNKPFDKVKKYKTQQTLRARILYTQPLTKLTFLTLKDFSSTKPLEYHIGAKIQCSVAFKVNQGLVVKLSDAVKGFVTNKRLLKCIKVQSKETEELDQLISAKFRIDSKHECTILDYNHIENMFICTFEKVNEVLSLENLKVGQLIKGQISKMVDSGIVVKVGTLDTFVQNDHLSNVQYSENIKKRFKIGQNVEGKIWYLDVASEKVLLTLKSNLLNNNGNLTSYEEIVLWEKVYSGVVSSKASRKGVLIVFYGGVKGWLPFTNVPHLSSASSRADAAKGFYIGQIVKVRICNYVDGKMTLTQFNEPRKAKRGMEIVSKINEIDRKRKNGEEISKKNSKVTKTESSDEGVSSLGEDIEDKSEKKGKKRKTSTGTLEIECVGKKNTKISKKDDEKEGKTEEGQSKKEKKEKNKKIKNAKNNEITDLKDDHDENVKVKTDEEQHKKEKTKKKKQNIVESDEETPVPILPSMSSFFNSQSDTQQELKQSSDDDDEEEDQNKTKKKKTKLTPAERTLLRKQEEERLRRIENELADASRLPQSADQFDRALLGNPEDSELWTRYIAFHVQSTEFDKARSVAKQALSRIPYTCVQERLNIWLAYLNLENLYGTKESFEKVFEEAARSNDTMTIYLEVIKMLCDMQKWNEMEELIKKARGKFKQEVNMWLEIGKVFYKCQRFADARKLKDNALLTLTDKKTHIQIIVQFALMEFNYGESAQGEALLETLLQVDPKRVDIWCTYVDQLVKKDKIDIARSVLNRAVGQKLAYKKMRTLFKKFHNFELTHGDATTQKHVKDLLQEFSNQEQATD